MFIIKYKKIFISISIILVSLSIFSIMFFGLKIGIDFKGGSIIQVIYKENETPEQNTLNQELQKLFSNNIVLQPIGNNGYLIKTHYLNQEEQDSLLKILSRDREILEKNFNLIGPSIGNEFTRKALFAIFLVVLVIIIFISFSFRNVSKSVPSWKYGVISIIALLHDIIIPTGIFAALSKFYGAEINNLFVIAILTILGLSISDTIVIFDRIRENLNRQDIKNKDEVENFSQIVGKSVNQSISRSLSTSITTIFSLIALFFWGPEPTKYFSLILIAGMFFGTYSSLFLASPLLVLAQERQKNFN